MPNIKSAIKRVKVSEAKNLRNRMVKSKVKTAIKKFETEIATAPANAAAQYSLTTSAIDKAAAKGILHKNTASRKKARLAKQLAKAQEVGYRRRPARRQVETEWKAMPCEGFARFLLFITQTPRQPTGAFPF